MPPAFVTPPLPVVPLVLLEPPTVTTPPPPLADPPLALGVPATFPETEPAVELPLELVPACASEGESSGEHAPVASKAADER
jgi:hypothetical protein